MSVIRKISFYAALLAMHTVITDVMAAPAGIGDDSGKPIEITADSLEVSEKDSVAVFSGKVEAIQGGMHLKADKMKVFYKGGGSGNQAVPGAQKISKIVAEGSVKIISAEEAASGSKGIYDVDKSLVILTGDVVLTKDKNVLKGERFEYDLKTSKSRMLSADATVDATGKPTGGRVKGLFVPENSR